MDGTAKTPDVRLPPMSLTSDDLWSHPVGSPSYLGSCDCHVTQSRNRMSYIPRSSHLPPPAWQTQSLSVLSLLWESPSHWLP